MHALVTGGYGFIGSHLVDLLVAEKWRVTVLDRYQSPFYQLPNGVEFIAGEVNNRGLLRRALGGVDVVFHLAWSGVHQSSNLDLRGHVETNLLPSLDLFEVCLEAKTQRVVFVSSGGTVYGKIRQLPTPEDHPAEPVSAYGVTKLSIEKYLSLFGFLHGLEYVVLRPSVPYGERQNPFGSQGAVGVFMGKLLKDEPIEIWGDGEVRRDFFYVCDLARALYLAGTSKVTGGIFNIGGKESISLNQLVENLGKVTGRKIRVNYSGGRIFDVPEVNLDISLAADKLEWEPETELMEGLARTWAWIKRCKKNWNQKYFDSS